MVKNDVLSDVLIVDYGRWGGGSKGNFVLRFCFFYFLVIVKEYIIFKREFYENKVKIVLEFCLGMLKFYLVFRLNLCVKFFVIFFRFGLCYFVR